MPIVKTCSGVDIGRSAVKVVSAWGNGERAEVSFPSAICKARPLTEDAGKAEMDTVQVNGQAYFVGETALLQGQNDLVSGLSDEWAFSDHHAALLLGAMKHLAAAGAPAAEKGIVIAGLPARLYGHQRSSYQASILQHLPNAVVRVSPQPMGPYYTMLFDKDGKQIPDFKADDESWAIVEIGQFTSDFALIGQGRPIELGFGSTDGMLVAATNLQRILTQKGFKKSIGDATKILETGTFRHFGETINAEADIKAAVEPLAEAVLDKATQQFGDWVSKLDGVRIAGGGARLVSETFKKQWRHTSVADNPRYTVAEGFCRFGIALANR